MSHKDETPWARVKVCKHCPHPKTHWVHFNPFSTHKFEPVAEPSSPGAELLQELRNRLACDGCGREKYLTIDRKWLHSHSNLEMCDDEDCKKFEAIYSLRAAPKAEPVQPVESLRNMAMKFLRAAVEECKTGKTITFNADHLTTLLNALLAQPPQTAKDKVCAEIQNIMRIYREQDASSYGVDTPGGLEHMGDVWKLLSEWDCKLGADVAAISPGTAQPKIQEEK